MNTKILAEILFSIIQFYRVNVQLCSKPEGNLQTAILLNKSPMSEDIQHSYEYCWPNNVLQKCHSYTQYSPLRYVKPALYYLIPIAAFCPRFSPIHF